jgi:hypothetical protein
MCERPVLFHSKIDARLWSQNIFESRIVDSEVWAFWLGYRTRGLVSNDRLLFLRYTLRAKSVAMHIDALTSLVLTLQLEGRVILVLDLPIARSRSTRLT